MGTAKLNIWVSDLDEPCRISNRTWYVTIYHCDGKPLEWCGRKFVAIPAKCGHLEIAVPPGCYSISAVWSFWIGPGGVFHGNHFTDHAIVQACCGEEQCVTLYTPTAHRCGIIFTLAIRDLVAQNVIKPELAKRAEAAIAEIIAATPKPTNQFELGHLEEIEKLGREQERQGPK